MHRFFVPSTSIQANQVFFPPEISHQICRVLRLRPGQRVIVLDGAGNEYEAEISSLESHAVQADICSRGTLPVTPTIQLNLYVSLTQREKFEWMLQKCCEAGVSSFIPFISSRTLVQDEANIQSRLPRWQKILQEAAEQCGRRDIPTIHAPLRWQGVLQSASQAPCALLAWEREQATTLKQALHARPTQIAALIGPEGGFSIEEVQQAQQSGIQLVTLGPRTLRMETAALVLAALVMYELENT